MSVRTPWLAPSKSTQRKRGPKLWDGLTVSLALAVVLLGFVIFLAPKNAQPERTPSKRLPATMAQTSAATSPAA